jgi:hypothetical protein
MSKANDYVSYFYNKYQGRIAIGVGYNQNLAEIYPIVFQNSEGESIGIVAIGAIHDEDKIVYIYHLGAFESRCGDGSLILKELCDQADAFDVSLRASAIVMPNGKDPVMTTGQLIGWYKRFGFKNNAGLLREPRSDKE